MSLQPHRTPTRRFHRVLFAAGALVACPVADAAELPPAGQGTVDFRRDVYPVLSGRCFRCHHGRDASSGHRLDDRAELLGETTGQPLVKIGQSADSRLIQLASGLDPELVMPPEGRRLTAEEIGVLRAWIDQGLEWDESLLPPVLAKTDHWAFQPVVRPAIPQAQNAAWIETPVDAFVAAAHDRAGLSPAAEAERRVLLRRLSLDLLGFPPAPDEVERFGADRSPDAYERLVDRLLSSPQHGVHWARHWLDVARWSETEGYESNHPRPFAWRYRDWVVDSFNADTPYDQFLRQQIAGDELLPYRDENLIATGFLAAARLSSNEEDKWLQRNAVLVDAVNTVGSAFLGLTVGCAQCHNHKFDPISTRDYYRLLAYFQPGQPLPVALRSPELQRIYEARGGTESAQTLALKTTLFEKARARMIAEAREKLSPEVLQAVDTPADERTREQELMARRADLDFQATPNGIEKYIAPEDRKLYDELKKRLERLQLDEPQTFAWYSPLTSPHELKVLPQIGFYPLPYEPQKLARRRPYIQVRGDVHNIGPAVTPGWPEIFETVFTPDTVADEPASSGDAASGSPLRGRTELADWLTDRRHPLVARVWVNRLWHYHFGRGLVDPPGDFGVRTPRPVHAELLDWLAAELIESGWSTKHVQRLIVNSATYRQSATASPAASANAAIDPQNEFLWHFSPRRLESEALRDAMLAVTGELDSALRGESVPLDEADASHRRSLYLFQKRGLPPEMQGLFDGPSESAESCSRRHTSTTPLQSLYLLNAEFVLNRARALARQIVALAGPEPARQIEEAFVCTLGRTPDDQERAAAQRFFQQYRPASDDEALVAYCHALLNLNEFAYVE